MEWDPGDVMIGKHSLFHILLLLTSFSCIAEENPIDMSEFNDSVRHARYRYEGYIPPYDTYSSRQIRGIAENMLFFQNDDGGWPKNIDWYIKTDKLQLQNIKDHMVKYGEGLGRSTFDNRSTYSHITYLAKVYKQIPDVRYKEAIINGIEWTLSVQNKDSGGFSGIDIDAVTYNDDVMTGVLRVLREIYTNNELYGFLDDDLRFMCQEAYQKGIQCILDTQVIINGRLTAWGQQHDHKTLGPVKARDYEPASITANESVGIILLLMEIENPSEEIKTAIIYACNWLNSVRVRGKMLMQKSMKGVVLWGRYYDYERFMIDNRYATDLWCRFYDTETEQPLLYDRGGVKVEHYNDLSIERRNGYGYYGNWPEVLLEINFPKWKIKHNIN